MLNKRVLSSHRFSTRQSSQIIKQVGWLSILSMATSRLTTASICAPKEIQLWLILSSNLLTIGKTEQGSFSLQNRSWHASGSSARFCLSNWSCFLRNSKFFSKYRLLRLRFISHFTTQLIHTCRRVPLTLSRYQSHKTFCLSKILGVSTIGKTTMYTCLCAMWEALSESADSSSPLMWTRKSSRTKHLSEDTSGPIWSRSACRMNTKSRVGIIFSPMLRKRRLKSWSPHKKHKETCYHCSWSSTISISLSFRLEFRPKISNRLIVCS